MTTLSPQLNTSYLFDARGVAKRFRHAAIFGALESLHDGEVMRFVNDHDPLPLLEQVRQRYGQQVTFRYAERQPEMIVIEFQISLNQVQEAAPASSGGCGGGGGCGCSGQ
ncbi:DUF2249 domain-containing protein [Aquitalea sp. LB_tupeE]|uniref:DUF2249 domain-containing protein n=1 Tax=Aquitalea sp. LB_tupeE TaxID=2748078 RepID=UPI0015BC47E9|nr:DUF2249 domain-containing protein [Aquitalea sp. LB_tupeE]NWK79095.1 DUF2249 domain-containing protein [Aquitalea sp. LB_tupeE]